MKKLLIAAMLILSLGIMGCGGQETNKSIGDGTVPSGENCQENVAYLQGGVNKFQEATGAYPANVQLLLEQKDGKGPFVEKVPECPSGNIYVIDNGTVKEAPRQ